MWIIFFHIWHTLFVIHLLPKTVFSREIKKDLQTSQQSNHNWLHISYETLGTVLWQNMNTYVTIWYIDINEYQKFS